MRKRTKPIARSEYDIDSACGPPCPECRGEMGLDDRVWRCPGHKLSRMPYKQGLDMMDRLRHQSAVAREARVQESLNEIDPGIGVLGELLADSLALNKPN